MYKFIICAGLLLFSSAILHAHRTGKVLNENKIPGINEEDANPLLLNKNSVLENRVKKLPLFGGKEVTVSTVFTGKRTGDIIVNDGELELATTGFRRKNLYGVWQSRYDNGNRLDSGRFVNNIPDGEWRSWYPNGSIRSIRTYNSDKWYAIQNEIDRGNTRIYYYRLSTILSFKSKYFASVTSAAISFSTLPGEQIKYEPPYDYCLHHGLYMNFYPNGAVKDSGYYENGLRDGMWNEYYSNGVLAAQGAYIHGAKEGGWKFMNSEGKLIMLAEYRRGKLVYHKNYNGYHN